MRADSEEARKLGPRALASAAMLKRSVRSFRFPSLALTAALGLSWVSGATASPVLLAGSGSEKVHSTDVTLMQKDGKSVVSILPDYQGPLSGFAVIIPVPKDVSADHVTTLKREFVDRVAKVSAPKFAEFWEMDPCNPEELEQDWERDMTAKANTGFLGVMQTEPGKKVAKELLLDMKAKTKDGEYKETFVGDAGALKAWLEKKEYSLPEGGEANLSSYESAGYKFLALDVDVNRVELVGGDRAQLSPIRYFTGEEVKSLPTRFGLPSAAKEQELHIFTLVPEKRFEATNYKTAPIPTNMRVVTEYEEKPGSKFNLKEKMGEFYAALHDRFLAKNPKTFLVEYAYPSDTCGQPCTTEPLLPHEILSLGADVFEADLPEDVRRPKPPAPTAEEEAKLEAAMAEKETPKEKKAVKEAWEADRQELVARKGILERNKFILTRLHYRYASAAMDKDVELGPAAALEGGNALPQGELGESDLSIKESSENKFQARYNGVFPNKIVVKCDNPKPHRWGKPPRSYRGLRKIWVAEDLSRRNRKRVKLEGAVLSAVPALDLAGEAAKKAEEAAAAAAAAAPAGEEKKEGDCGCKTAGGSQGGSGWLMALGLGSLLAWRRRRVS